MIDRIPQAILDEYEEERIRRDAIEAAKSGGISGSILGGLTAAFAPKARLRNMAARALAMGTGGAALAGGGTYLGSKILGAPEGDAGDYTNRGALGGAIAGGSSGAGLGALLGSGGLSWLTDRAPPALKERAANASSSLVGKAVKGLMRGPNPVGRTAAALGLVGAGLGGLYGADEGMQLDYLESLDGRR